jgi:hypothetical protein
MAAHSGNKFGACFSSQSPNNPNNKWLISPKMSMGSEASIRFWVETYSIEYNLEKFNVGVSTTGTNPNNFVLLNGSPIEAPGEWTKQSFSLSAYSGQDVYLGINCVSDDQFIFMIDDIEIGSALGVDGSSSKTGVQVFPNPAADHVFINFGKTGLFVSDITLLNETGSTMREVTLNRTGDQIFSFPTSGLSAGLYYLVINTDEGRIVRKIAIVN